jgi:hypothetical protein
LIAIYRADSLHQFHSLAKFYRLSEYRCTRIMNPRDFPPYPLHAKSGGREIIITSMHYSGMLTREAGINERNRTKRYVARRHDFRCRDRRHFATGVQTGPASQGEKLRNGVSPQAP